MVQASSLDQVMLQTEFDTYPPSAKYAAVEQDGIMTSKKTKLLKMIKGPKSLPPVDLPAHFRHMVSHCWTSAKPAKDGPGSGLRIGGHRGASREDYRPMVSPTKQPMASAYLDGIAKDWKIHEEFNRVNAFTFRGETSHRKPADVRGADGFHPPVTRTDDWYIENKVAPEFSSYMKRRFGMDVDAATFLAAYKRVAVDDTAKTLLAHFLLWKGLLEGESLHLGRMLANELMKGYISTTREITVAKGFARPGGTVYLVLCRGGFEIPVKGDHQWTTIFGEQEIALPGKIPWDHVFGFRRMRPDVSKFEGPIYFRKGFEAKHKKAFETAKDLFSGKPQ